MSRLGSARPGWARGGGRRGGGREGRREGVSWAPAGGGDVEQRAACVQGAAAATQHVRRSRGEHSITHTSLHPSIHPSCRTFQSEDTVSDMHFDKCEYFPCLSASLSVVFAEFRVVLTCWRHAERLYFSVLFFSVCALTSDPGRGSDFKERSFEIKAPLRWYLLFSPPFLSVFF